MMGEQAVRLALLFLCIENPFLLLKLSYAHSCIDRLFVFESFSCSKAKRESKD